MPGLALVRTTIAALAVAIVSTSLALANSSDPFLFPYNQTTTVTFDPAQLSQAWQEWKSAQITATNAGGNGRLRVMGGVDGGSTVSEGQGYGILLASIFDDQTTLDGLWLFTSDHLNARGLMDWHIGSPGQRLGTGAATDADEDIALGLLNACIKVQRGSWPASRWGINYCNQATLMIGAIYQFEIDKAGGSPSSGLATNPGNELLPGDAWTLSSDYPQGIVNLSYFSPGYYTAFGRFTNERAAWANVITRNYEIVNLAQGKPGNCSKLVPNWVRYDGEPQLVPWQPNNFSWWSYDAARLAWRAAVDKAWYGTPDARATVNEIGSFFSSVGFDNIGEHSMNGQRTGSGPWPFFVANAAAAIWAADTRTPVNCGAATGTLRETPQSAYDRVRNTKDTPNSYYGNAWRLFAMLLITGNFPNFYEMSVGSAPPSPSPSPSPPPTPPPPPPPPPAPPPSSGSGCQVSYTIVTQWNSGFHADLTVVNKSATPITGYTLQWAFTSGERFSSGWNATYTQNGSVVTASNPAAHWNGTIGSNASITFGFIGTGTPGRPNGFTLNGVGCQG
ncbi:MAG TPA: glycosyl hydrolase family 8 [Vicinamibacterales bacterium]|nr:glycosyl hydrolase family 8 [Vicinamibacterales bacterium]